MGFKCGIIGLPNVGKSTLFNILTKSNIPSFNFPFCTIKSNKGFASIPDGRLSKIAKIAKLQRISTANIEIVDIAGLVKNASKGEGLGNQFLTHIREMDAIGHVVRCFEDESIIHVTGKIDPSEDIEIVNTELILFDLDVCERAIYHTGKRIRYGDRESKLELSVLKKCFFHLKMAKMLRLINLSEEDKNLIRYLNFLTLKPTMYIANVKRDGFEKNRYLDKVYPLSKKENTVVIPICASIKENENYLDNKGQNDFKEKNIHRILLSGYSLLNLQTYFTINTKEVRAWSVPIGTTASQAAKKIHTDFETGFIRANTISYRDFIFYGGEKGAKLAGKMRSEGKNYIIEDGDILNFLFNV